MDVFGLDADLSQQFGSVKEPGGDDADGTGKGVPVGEDLVRSESDVISAACRKGPEVRIYRFLRFLLVCEQCLVHLIGLIDTTSRRVDMHDDSHDVLLVCQIVDRVQQPLLVVGVIVFLDDSLNKDPCEFLVFHSVFLDAENPHSLDTNTIAFGRCRETLFAYL